MSKNYKFIDLKSSNLQFLSPDKNLRNTINRNVSSTNREFSSNSNINSLNTNILGLDTNIHSSFIGSTSH